MPIKLYNLLDQRKVMYCINERFKAYNEGNVEFAPWSIEIHPTAKCNLSCRHCSYALRNQTRLSLSKKALSSLIDDIVYLKVKGAYFSGGGEPLFIKELSEHINRLTACGVETAMLTNGVLLKGDRLFDAVRKLNYLAVSLPSVFPETYKRITGHGYVEDILAIPDKVKTGRKTDTIVGCRVVVSNENYKEVLKIADVSKKKGFDYAIFKIVRDYEDRKIGLPKDACDFLEKLIKTRDFPEDFTNLGNMLKGKSQAVLEKGKRCWAIDFRILANVHTNGDIYPCLPLIGKKEHAIGNLNEANFKDIWNSKRHKDVIARLHKRYKNGECKNCRAIAYNQLIDKFMKMFSEKKDPFL